MGSRKGSAVDVLRQVEYSSGLVGLVVMVLMVLKAKKNISLPYGLLRHLACFLGFPPQDQIVKPIASLAIRCYTAARCFGPNAPDWAQVPIAHVAYVLHPSSPTAPS